ncbi:hypothetical protein IAD21_03144 [Abditibacteriota bacterium]|nr:hypothetical protein IAD21_03144 [Abditibacteriota bacterium]
MTQPQSDTLTPYAPLPVRARGTLEIFDTAFKLFRRYAGVLLAWSALSSLINLIPILGAMAYIFTMPLMFGAVSCVVAAAVRGQNVSFKQIWGFTKPRYGALLGVLILAVILMSLVVFGLMFIISVVVILVASVAANFGWFATIVAWIVGTIGGLVGGSFLLAVVMGWFNLAPVIACLEDTNRGTNALSRAWSLLAGNWRKACGVATILALAGTAALMIISGFLMFFFYGGWDKFIGADTSFASGLAFSGFFTLFFVAWTPLQAVVGAVFYLDLRTRKEALDLEWTNYAAKPEMLPSQEQSAPPPNFPPTPMQPMGQPPYAPASSAPAQPSAPNFSPPPQTPIFSAQAPVPSQPNEAQPTAVGLTSATPVPDSFAAFASQMETAPPDSVPQAPTVIDLGKALTPETVEVQAVAAEPIVPAQPPVVVQPVPTPAPAEPPSVVVETAPAITNTAPTFGVPAAPHPLEPPSVPVAPVPPVVPVAPPPPVPEPQPEPAETSSFAPRRFRRAASEDDDYPSSFGGGAR